LIIEVNKKRKLFLMAKSKKQQQPSGVWVNNIVGHGEEDPQQLLAHPFNWRVHPKNQQDVVSGNIADLGYLKSVTVNRRTQHVLDGHLRVALAISQNQPTIPVEYVDIPEEAEPQALIFFDASAKMAGTDKENLEHLMGDIKTQDEALTAMLSNLSAESGFIPSDLNLDEFFTDGGNGPKEEKDKIILEYSPEEAGRVRSELLKHGASYEAAVWNLLGL
jgi:hypothetical protein